MRFNSAQMERRIAEIKSSQIYQSLGFEQKCVFDIAIIKQQNIFITGRAGSGKSYVLRAIIQQLKRIYTEDEIIVSASTGIAAQNIDALTFHSATGAFPKQDEQPDDFKKLTSEQLIDKYFSYSFKNLVKRTQLQKCKVFIIDEISQINANLFQGFDCLMKKIKHNQDYFGGIQVILTGDFMQLPPVTKGEQKYFCFDCESFLRGVTNKICLESNYRQQNDTKFLQILDKIRDGFIDDQVCNSIGSKQTSEFQIDQKQSKYVQQKKQEYQLEINKFNVQLQQIIESIKVSQNNLDQMCQNVYKYKQLKLKIKHYLYAPPIFPVRLYSKKYKVDNYNKNMLKTRTETLYTFIAADSGDQTKLEKLDRPDKIISICVGAQVMVNKNIDVEQKVTNGTLATICKIDIPDNYQSLTNQHYINQRQEKTINLKEGKKQPEITLRLQNGNDYKLQPADQQVKDQKERVIAQRFQFPLQLAYAITIHKSQGITLKEAIIDIGDCFEDGQMYVALSRLKDLDGLTVINFNEKSLKANKHCLEFMEQLDRIFMKNGQVNKKYFNYIQAEVQNKFLIPGSKQSVYNKIVKQINSLNTINFDIQEDSQYSENQDEQTEQKLTQDEQQLVTKQSNVETMIDNQQQIQDDIDDIQDDIDYQQQPQNTNEQDQEQNQSQHYVQLQDFLNNSQQLTNNTNQVPSFRFSNSQNQQQDQNTIQSPTSATADLSQETTQTSKQIVSQSVQPNTLQSHEIGMESSSSSIEIVSDSLSQFASQKLSPIKVYKQTQLKTQPRQSIGIIQTKQKSVTSSKLITNKDNSNQIDISEAEFPVKKSQQINVQIQQKAVIPDQIQQIKKFSIQNIQYTELKSQNKIFRQQKTQVLQPTSKEQLDKYLDYAKKIFPHQFQ